MIQQNFSKLASLSVISLLGWNLIAPQKAQAIIYDVDFSLNGFSATGTLETSSTGDLANGDFAFTNWEVFLDDGSGGAPEFTLTPANQSTTAPGLVFGTLNTGDIVATSNALSFSSINEGTGAFAIGDSSISNFLCFGSCISGTGSDTSIGINSVNQVDDTGALGANFAVFDAQTSASVPFEFSPTLGLLAVGGLFGVSRLRKYAKSLKLK